MLPGKKVDGILQAFIEVLVEDSVCFMTDNILIAEALPGCELIKKLSRVLKRADVDDTNFLYRTKERFEGAVKLRAEIPQDGEPIPSFFRQLPGGINHPHPIA